jgi:uncharacterized protein with NAD-binding domain and iron-sulfur cluster
MVESSERIKVAILGGGAGALAAAFGLTEVPDWKDRYEITIYQLGWRLGGKGASGRNLSLGERIEEHGPHFWAGFYENAFRIMRACYKELGRPPHSPLATVEAAFTPQDRFTLEEDIAGHWVDWHLKLLRKPGHPGDGAAIRPPWSCVRKALWWMRKTFHRMPLQGHHAPPPEIPGWLTPLLQKVEASTPDRFNASRVGAGRRRQHGPQYAAQAYLLQGAWRLARALPEDPTKHSAADYFGILWLLRTFKETLRRSIELSGVRNAKVRRLWILLDLVGTHIRGILRDGVLIKGFRAIDNEDWKAWLRRHGASKLALNSAIVRATYDYVFGFEQGDTSRPVLSAGVCVRGLLRVFFSYKGAIFYKMQAGMGDTVFAPLYLVLKHRGVSFKFFRRVENLGISPDGNAIDTIRLQRQVDLNRPEYSPLIVVKDLPCWPSTPDYCQIVGGDALEAQGIDLESSWSPYSGVETQTLRRGTEFDEVILGISVGALGDIAPELIAARPEWRQMFDQVKTVQTQAMELWFATNAAGLGLTRPPTIGAGYAEPFSDWGEMPQLIPREDWPAGDEPGYLAYLCGPLNEPKPIPPYSEYGFPAHERSRVFVMARAWLRRYAGHLWPNLAPPGAGDLDWSLLYDPSGAVGPDRLLAQYFRANINPSDRYVLSVPGSTRYRLGGGSSGFLNLYLAGDWVDTPINAGCVEAAVMGGLQAARALSGFAIAIAGEDGWDT